MLIGELDPPERRSRAGLTYKKSNTYQQMKD